MTRGKSCDFRLETIILSDNQLSSISFEDSPPTGTTRHFPKLKSITINQNNIAEVRSMFVARMFATSSDWRPSLCHKHVDSEGTLCGVVNTYKSLGK